MRNEVIRMINDIYDENIKLKNKLYNNEIMMKCSSDKHSLQNIIYESGLEYLFENSFVNYYDIKNYGGKIIDFDDWVDMSVSLQNFNDISLNQFKTLFNDRMKEIYDKKIEEEKEKEKNEIDSNN